MGVGEDGKFLKSLYIVGREVLTPIIGRPPLYCLTQVKKSQLSFFKLRK